MKRLADTMKTEPNAYPYNGSVYGIPDEEMIDKLPVCEGCQVRRPWEHRCFGADRCGCAECRDVERELASRAPMQRRLRKPAR